MNKDESVTNASDAPDLSASSEELERLLAEAEQEIAAIRAELESRRVEETKRTVAALPDDLSSVQGRWADLKVFLAELLDRES